MKKMTVGLVLLLIASCGESAEPWTVTDADSGSELAVEHGDMIEVVLESNPSTGYEWVLDPVLLPDMVVLVADEYVPPDDDLVGAPGRQIFTFETLDAGAGVVRLEYVRPWEATPIPERVAEFVVRVDGALWPPEVSVVPPGTSTASVPIEVRDLGTQAPGELAVRGFVVWDSNGARLCEVLMESYPPQCGGAASRIENPEALTVTLEEAQGVKWSSDPVTLTATYDGSGLLIAG